MCVLKGEAKITGCAAAGRFGILGMSKENWT